jgi:hypothetical protein
MGCPIDLSKSNCGIDGTWLLDISGDNGGVRGTPNDTTIAISHDSAGQYYVSQTEETGYSGFSYSPQDCTLEAYYHWETIIPPSNGSSCGLVSSDCEMQVVFSSGAGSGTLLCTGHPNTCVGVSGGSAVLQVKAVSSNPAFTVDPPAVDWSGSAGFGAANTVTIRANVNLTGLSVSISSGSNMPLTNNCATSLASGESCTVVVTTCATGTYSTHQESGQILIRSGGEHSQSVTVPVSANCYSS